ncbi:hypothetical protein [Reyranella sp.]|uniref:hypothetical protein n=1 Tax=Reyranella sp. TaxID=1929291 RepID=UPI003BAC07E9
MSVIATYVYVSRDGGGDGSSDAYTMSFADALRFRSGSDDLIVVDATVGAADLNALDASTDGTVVTEPYVTMVTGSLPDVAAAYGSSGISGLGDETVALDDTTVAAADLLALDTAASGLIDASSVTTVTGSLSDVGAAYASSGISGLGNAAVTLDDTTVPAADLSALDTATSGTIDASSVTTVTGSLSDVGAAYASSGIGGLGNAAVILDDTTVAAADLNALDALTSGVIDASSVTTLMGSLSDVATAYASSEISGLGNAVVTLDDATVAAGDLNALDVATNGTIDASSVTTLTGSLSAVAMALSSYGIMLDLDEAVTLDDTTVAAGDLNALDAVTNGTIDASSVTTLTGSLSAVAMALSSYGIMLDLDEAVTLDDTTVAAADLNALDTATSGTIDASPVTTVTGSLSDVGAAYASSGISGLGNAAVTLDDTTVAAADLLALDTATSGTIDASSVTTVTGSLSDVGAAYASSGISGLGNAAVTLDDTTVAAADLSALDTATSGTIDASSVTTVTGSLSDVGAAYASSGIGGLGNAAVTLDDTSVPAADLNALDDETSGAINASSVTMLTGTASAVATAYASSGIIGLGNAAVTLSVGTVAATDLYAIDLATSGNIYAGSVTTLTGSLSYVADVYASFEIFGLGVADVTLDDATVRADSLFELDTLTIGTIDASSVTTLFGALSAVSMAYILSGISGLGDEAVTLDDTTVAASDLLALDALTTGVIDASSVTTLTGSLSDVADVYASVGIVGLAAADVTLSDTTVAASDVNALDTATNGMIDASSVTTFTGSLSDADVLYASGGIAGPIWTAAWTLSDTTVAASDLNNLEVTTYGIIDASSVTALTGSLSDVAAAYASSGISGLGNEAVTLSDTTVAAADLNALDAKTTGVIDASSVTTLTGGLQTVRTTYQSGGISGLGNEAVTLSDTILPAVALVTMDGYTSGTVDASAALTLSGSLSYLAAAYASSGITGLGNEAVTLNNSTVAAADLNALDMATSGTINASSVTTLTGMLSAVATAYASSGISGLGNAAVTLSDTTAAAADLNALDTATSGVIDASSVTTLTGTAAAVAAAYASSGISGLGNEAVTLSAGTAAASDLNTINAATSGTIDASSVTTLTGGFYAVYANNNSYGAITGLGDEAVTLTDANVAAADLNALDDETSGTIDASSVTELVGDLSDVAAAYASSGISGLGDEAVSLGYTTVAAADLSALDIETSGTIDASNVLEVTGSLLAVRGAYSSSGISGLGAKAVTLDDTTAAAADLNALDTATSGVIDASSVTTLTGTAAAVATAYASSGISGLGNAAVTLSDTTAAAADLNAIDAATGGTIDASSVTTVTGALSNLATAYASSGITGLGNEELTLSDTTVAASDVNALDTATTGMIDASSVTTFTGSLSDADVLYASGGIAGPIWTAGWTLNDTTVAASDLNNLEVTTSGMIDASSVTALTGSLSDVAAAYASSGISGLGTAAVTLEDTTAAVADLNAIDTATSGTIDAASVTTVTGSLSNVATAYGSSGISGLGNEAVTLSDTTVAAADLNALDAKTTGVIDASSVTTLTGAVSVVRTTYLSSGISGLGNEAVTLSDTILPAVALVTMDGYTSGTVDASSVTTLTGPLSYLAAAYASSGITGLGNEAVTLNNSTVAAADLNALDTATSGIINASSVATLTGSLSAVATAYASSGISGLGNAAVTLSDTTAAAADLNALDTATSGVIDASSVTTLTGTAAAVATAYASSGISGLGNEAVTLSAGTAAASDLNAIDAATSGAIDAAAVTVLTGSLSAVAAAHASAGITGLGDEHVTLSDTTVAASDVNALDTATTGMIDASSVTTFTGSLSDADALYASGGIAGPIWTAAWTLNDTTVAASDLNNLEVTTSGTIDASSVTAVTGTAAAVATAYAASGISGLGNAAVALSDTTAAAADLNAIDAATIGTIDASSVTTLTGTAAAVAMAYASSGISGLGNERVLLWDTVAAAAALNAINAATTGEFHAQSVLTVTGSLSDLTTTYTNGGIRGFGDEAITLTDATVAASSLNNLDRKTTGGIDASSVTAVTGTAAAVAASYVSSGISGLGTADVTLSATSATASALNAIDANTTGTVDALSVERIYGTASDVATAYASSGISGLGDEQVRLWDTVAAAAALNAINAATTGELSAQSVLTVTGSLSDLTTTYTNGGIRGFGDEAITLTDATVAASSLNNLDRKTTGGIDASSVTAVTGTAAAVAASYVSSGISGLGTADVTLSATSATASALNAIDANTTGTVDALSVERIYGTASDLATAYASSGISGLGNERVLLLDTVAAAADLNAINAATSSGTIYMGSILTVTGSLSDLAVTYSTSGFSGRGDEAVILSDTVATATAINFLDGKTSGTIDASSVTTLTGTVSDVSTAIASAGISGLENAAFDITGTASADTIQGGAHDDTLSGLGGSDSLSGFGGNDNLDGGTGADAMTGGTGADSFIFVAGEANGDSVTDFSGSWMAGDGDVLVFRGYGDGASFTDLGGGHYEVANAARTVVDVIEVTGSIDVTDHRFELVV